MLITVAALYVIGAFLLGPFAHLIARDIERKTVRASRAIGVIVAVTWPLLLASLVLAIAFILAVVSIDEATS